jgi:hypothetical protein
MKLLCFACTVSLRLSSAKPVALLAIVLIQLVAAGIQIYENHLFIWEAVHFLLVFIVFVPVSYGCKT